MSIGIMDSDFSTYTYVPFNLEAMKTSAYYKGRREIVVLTNDFTPQRHKQFFYFKDYEDGIYPKDLLTTPNVKYSGLAFSNNQYSPLPYDIEIMRPDTSLYESKRNLILKGNIYGKKAREKIYKNLITAEHIRISLDSKNIWSDYPKQLKSLSTTRNIIFHDYDLNQINGGYDEVKRILSFARRDSWATRIGMKFPVQIYTGQDLVNWTSLRTNSTFYSVTYNGVIEDNDAFNDWVGICKEKTMYRQMEYIVTNARYDENRFINELLPKIFKQVLISRSYNALFSLKYDEDFFTDKRWCSVLRLFNLFANSYTGVGLAAFVKKVGDDTLFNFVSSLQEEPKFYFNNPISKGQAREIFYFVRENQPELFKDFYECTANKLGGKL